MEMPIFSPAEGQVVAVKLKVGDVAEADQEFCVIQAD